MHFKVGRALSDVRGENEKMLTTPPMREGEVNVSYLENKAKDMCCALCCFLNHYKQKCKPNLIMILIASLVWVNRVTGTIHNNTEYWHHVRVTC